MDIGYFTNKQQKHETQKNYEKRIGNNKNTISGYGITLGQPEFLPRTRIRAPRNITEKLSSSLVTRLEVGS